MAASATPAAPPTADAGAVPDAAPSLDGVRRALDGLLHKPPPGDGDALQAPAPGPMAAGLAPRPEDKATISHSALLMAGRRAVESEQAHPIFVDPLAARFAGPDGVDAARARQPWLARFPRAPDDARFPVSFLGVRTRWFDDTLLDAAAGLTGRVGVTLAADDAAGTVRAALVPEACAPISQVLCLGAGVDGRPWRLPLSGVSWFEVDDGDVVDLKRGLLAREDAQTDVADGTAHAFPLTARSYSLVAADLTQRGWGPAVLAAGWDPAAPAAVVLEGLSYYIGRAGIDNVCAEAAALAPPGSFLLVDVMNVRGLERVRTRPGSVLEKTWTYGCDVDPGPEYAARGWPLQWVSWLAEEARRIQQHHQALGRAPPLKFGFDVDPPGTTPGDTMTLLLLGRRAG